MVLNGQQVESILGKKVRGTAGDDMGRIIDIIADKTGQVRAAIVDFGGFLGVGNRQIAVDWKAIRFPTDGKTDAVIVDLSKDQLRVAPVYKPGEQIVVLGQQPAGAAQAPPAPAPQAATDTANPVAKDTPSK
jgi:sporulation protein YlmC with PRC-barrel domain